MDEWIQPRGNLLLERMRDGYNCFYCFPQLPSPRPSPKQVSVRTQPQDNSSTNLPLISHESSMVVEELSHHGRLDRYGSWEGFPDDVSMPIHVGPL